MVNELFKALQAGVNPILIANPQTAVFVAEVFADKSPAIVQPTITTQELPVQSKRGRSYHHIKRDGRTLCGLKDKDIAYGHTITWNQALKEESTLNCCPQCAEVFYARLNRTLIVQ